MREKIYEKKCKDFLKRTGIKTIITALVVMFAIIGITVAQEFIPANISGMKFNDLNDNGIKDPEEPGLSNWTIELSQPGQEFPTTTLTDNNGNYIFPGLASGNYAITEVIQTGWKQTAPQEGVYKVNLNGEDATGLDFGNFNTSQAIPEEVRQDEMSDLVAVELIPSTAYPLPGEQVDLQLKILNRAINSEKNVEIILLADGKKVDSRVADIDPESTKTINLVWQATQGTSKLVAVVDPDHKLTEQNAQDNVVSVDVAVAQQPPREADFAVVDLQTDVGVLRATLSNHGTVAAQAPFVLQADGQIATLQLLEIEPGQSMTIEIPWSSQPPVAQLSGEINSRYRAAEKNPDDNILSRDLRPPVDIRVEGLSVSAEKFDPSRPRQITVSFRIVNGGQQAITTPFRTSVFPGAITDENLDTFYVDTPILPAGQTVYVSRTLVSPVGEFDVRVGADVDHKITEADESNNIATAHYKNPSPDVGRWVSIGPRLITNNIGYPFKNSVGVLFSIAVDPTDPSTIYVGSHGSGVWKTINGGASWQVITDSLPIMAISAIAIDPSDTSRIYVATPDYGVFRSEDGGTSWVQLDTSWTPRNIKLRITDCCDVLLVNPNNPDILYLTSLNGVYRSIDRGLTWGISLSTPSQAVTSLVKDSSNPDILYAGVYGDGIYKTTDGGSIWNKLTSPNLPTTDIKKVLLALSRDNPNTIYTIFGKTAGGFDLFRSDDAGGTWSKQSTLNFYIAILGVDPANPNVVYLGGVDFYRSADGGKNFGITSGPDGPHADHHGFANHPTDLKVIYVVGDGGIYISSDQGKSGTWTFIGEGIINVELYDIANAATDPNMVIGGTQDNGNIKYDASSTVWKMIRGDDGGTVDVDPTDAGIFYTMGQYAGSIAKHHGNSIDGIAKNLPTASGVCFNLHFQVHPATPTTLLASCDSLWRTTTSDPPGDWKEILTPSSEVILRSAVDPSADLYYAGSNNGRIYAGPAGANWQTVFTNPIGFGVTDIDVDPNNPETIYVSFSGAGITRVYRLQRSSPTPTTMTSQDITSNLPIGIGVNTIVVDGMTPLTIYAGTNKGVYRGHSNDGGATWFWVPYDKGLPFANIRTLIIQPTTKIIRAGTFGRSAFEVITGPLGKISGTKFNDINGNGIKDIPSDTGINNWRVILTRQSDGTKLSTKTDPNGNYAFSALDADTYTVEEVLQPGWIQTAPAISATGSVTYTVPISAGEDITDKDFGNFKFGEVHGQKFEDLNANSIKDENETGLTGWNITINGTDTITNTPVNLITTTDINGEYNFTGLTAGTYIISETLKSGWVQTAPVTGNYTVTITSGSNITRQDFGNFHKGKITGGGWISIIGDPKATFGIDGQYPDSKSEAQGNVEYQDHIKNLNIKSTKINTVATTLNKKKGVITGLATVNGAGSYPFEVYVEDNGEPGKGNDVFKISLPGLPYSNGAILNGGNIQIHS